MQSFNTAKEKAEYQRKYSEYLQLQVKNIDILSERGYNYKTQGSLFKDADKPASLQDKLHNTMYIRDTAYNNAAKLFDKDSGRIYAFLQKIGENSFVYFNQVAPAMVSDMKTKNAFITVEQALNYIRAHNKKMLITKGVDIPVQQEQFDAYARNNGVQLDNLSEQNRRVYQSNQELLNKLATNPTDTKINVYRETATAQAVQNTYADVNRLSRQHAEYYRNFGIPVTEEADTEEETAFAAIEAHIDAGIETDPTAAEPTVNAVTNDDFETPADETAVDETAVDATPADETAADVTTASNNEAIDDNDAWVNLPAVSSSTNKISFSPIFDAIAENEGYDENIAAEVNARLGEMIDTIEQNSGVIIDAQTIQSIQDEVNETIATEAQEAEKGHIRMRTRMLLDDWIYDFFKQVIDETVNDQANDVANEAINEPVKSVVEEEPVKSVASESTLRNREAWAKMQSERQSEEERKLIRNQGEAEEMQRLREQRENMQKDNPQISDTPNITRPMKILGPAKGAVQTDYEIDTYAYTPKEISAAFVNMKTEQSLTARREAIKYMKTGETDINKRVADFIKENCKSQNTNSMQEDDLLNVFNLLSRMVKDDDAADNLAAYLDEHPKIKAKTLKYMYSNRRL